MHHVLATAVVSLALLGGSARPAAAGGGDVLSPVQDRYEPGETATMVGYTSSVPGTVMRSGGVDDGPYYGHLRTDPATESGVPLGPATVTETGRTDRFAVRLSITFTVPADLAPGTYDVGVCDEGCTHTLGDLVGGAVYVGVDPVGGVDRDWLIDDPAVALVPDDALVAGIPAARIRAGQAGTPWYDRPPPAPAPTLAPAPSTSAAASSGSDAATADGEDPVPGADRVRSGPDAPPDRAAGGPGVADVAPWLVPLALVLAVWGVNRRRPAVVAPTGYGRREGARPR